MPKPFTKRPDASKAFPTPAGSAGAAHFAGDRSLAQSERGEALRARAEGRAPRPVAPARPADLGAPPSAPAVAPPVAPCGGAWPRPPACLTAAQLHLPPEKAVVAVAGLVIVRQRPGSAKGVLFITLEDETGVVNVVVWTRVYERFRRAVMAGRLLRVIGRIQRDGQVVHVVADRIEDMSHLLDSLAAGGPRLAQESLAHADEVRRPNERGSRPEKTDAALRAQGVLKRAAPRAMHPRDQAKLLFRDRPI